MYLCHSSLQCNSFSSWYPDFQKVTFKSVVLPIPDDVMDYLMPKDDNGLFLPVECDQVSKASFLYRL